MRVFLFISFMPKLRMIVRSLLISLPGIFGISVLLVLIFYVFGVIATLSLSEYDPDHFGNLGKSLFSLFQIMTLDNWSIIARPIVYKNIYAYLFFVPFILLSSYIILNIFIAIIVNGMRDARLKHEYEERKRNAKIEVDREEANILLIMNKLEELQSSIINIEKRIGNNK